MAIFVTDTFTEASTVVLPSHIGEIGATWTRAFSYSDDPRISAAIDQLVLGASTTAAGYASGVPATAEYTIEYDYVYKGNQGSACGATGRHSTSANTFYHIRFEPVSAFWQLFKTVAGSFTVIGSYAQTLTEDQTYAVRLVLLDGFKEVWINEVKVISLTDNEITNPGRVGVRFLFTALSSDNYMDNLVATDAGGGGLTIDLSDTMPISDSISLQLTKAITDTINLSETITKKPNIQKSDSILLSEAISKTPNLSKSDTITLTDNFSSIITLILVLSDSMSMADAISKSVTLNKSDTINLTDSFSRIVEFTRAFADEITLAESISKQANLSMADTISMSDNFSHLVALILNLADSISMSDEISKSVELIKSDTITMTEEISKTFNLSMADVITLADQFSTDSDVIIALLNFVAKHKTFNFKAKTKTFNFIAKHKTFNFNAKPGGQS